MASRKKNPRNIAEEIAVDFNVGARGNTLGQLAYNEFPRRAIREEHGVYKTRYIYADGSTVLIDKSSWRWCFGHPATLMECFCELGYKSPLCEAHKE